MESKSIIHCASFSDTFKCHCPRDVKWAVNINNNEMFLCDRCYTAVKAGAFKNLKIFAEINVDKFRKIAKITG